MVGVCRAVCFDFDGTLAAYDGDFDLLLDGLRVELGLVACDFTTFKRRLGAELRRDGPLTLASALTVALNGLELRVPDDLGEVVAGTVRSYAQGVGLKGGALELLAELHEQRVPMALISNGPVDMQRAAVATTGVERYFQTILISGDRDVAARKPHPRIFQLACTGLETEPRETLMVGDDVENDIGGALGYGMPALLLGRDGTGGQEFNRVDDLVALRSELMAMLSGDASRVRGSRARGE